MSTRRGAAAAIAALALAGCNVQLRREHPLACGSDEQRLVRETLYLGTGIPGGGAVDDAAWAAFAEQVVTPAFPQGYSVLDAHGQWRGTDGITRGEASRLVVIVHVDEPRANASARQIAQRYRDRFHQEAVLRERAAVCGSFSSAAVSDRAD